MEVKMYRTYRDFEQQELYRMGPLYQEIDEIIDELFVDGLETRLGGLAEREADEEDDWQ